MQNSKPSLNHQKTPKPQDPPHANTPDPTLHTKVTLCTKIQTGQDRCASSQRNIPRAKKMICSKGVPRLLGMLKQMFLGRFEPVVARFGPWKIPKCLENGPFQDQKWVKNGPKTRFSKSDPAPFMMLKQVVLAHFEPVVTRFSPWKFPKCLENGSFWEQKWVKNGSKTRFSKNDPGPFGMLKQVFF